MLAPVYGLSDTLLYVHVVEDPLVEAEPLEIRYWNPPLVVYLVEHQDEVILAWIEILLHSTWPKFQAAPFCNSIARSAYSS